MKSPAYVVLARKYRPQLFAEVVGQDAVAVTLKNAIESKRLHHAYLFTGPRGIGKTTTARLLAKALNCAKGPTPEPCGSCEPCREIAGSSAIDVLEMDAASHTGVDNVREVIIETVALAPSRDRYKIFIIDEAHMLSTAAFNALLKTLEEPPSHVVFILATTESAKIPATISSRCQRFRFRPVSTDLMAAHLGALAKKEKIAVEPEALRLLALSAGGSLRDAISLLDQSHSFGAGKITADMIREMFGFVPQELLLGAAEALFSREPKVLAGHLRKIYEAGVEPAQLLKDLREALQALYLGALGVPSETLAGEWKTLAQGLTADHLGFLLRRINKTLEELRFSDSPRLTLELGLFGCLEAAGDLEAWVKRLEGLERRAAGGETAPPAPSRGAVPAPSRPQASAPAPSVPVRGIWAQVLEALKEKPALSSVLSKARLEQGAEGSPWRLIFSREFDLKAAEHNRAAIEAILATKAGRQVPLKFEAGPAPASSAPEPADAAAGEDEWQEGADEPPAAPHAGPLKKAEGILGGTVRFVKKRPS